MGIIVSTLREESCLAFVAQNDLIALIDKPSTVLVAAHAQADGGGGAEDARGSRSETPLAALGRVQRLRAFSRNCMSRDSLSGRTQSKSHDVI